MVETDIKKALRLSLIEGAGASVFLILIQGFVFTKIALEFGVDELLLGFLMGIQLLSQVFQIFVPMIINRLQRRKPFVIIFVAISRAFWPLLLLISVLGWANQEIFITIISLSFIFGAFAGNAWTSWMRDLIPDNKMGSFFGLRNLINTVVSLVFTWVFSRILEHNPNIHGVRIVILIGFICALWSLFFLYKQYDPPLKDVQSGNLFKIVVSDKNNIRLMVFGGFWNFAILFTAPFFSYHQIENLNMSFSFLGYLSITLSGVMILTVILWGKLADRIGHKNILRIGVSAASAVSIMWFFMAPQNLHVLMWVDAVLAGTAWSAINLSIFTLPLIVGGKSAGVLYGFFSAINGVFGFLGSILGGVVAKSLSGVTFKMLELDMNGLQIMFLLGGLMRLCSLYFLNNINVSGHIKMRTVLGQKVVNINRRLSRDFFEPMPRYMYLKSLEVVMPKKAKRIKKEISLL